MPKPKKLTKGQLEKAGKKLYHHLYCDQMKELTVTLSKKGKRLKAGFALMGLSSKETIKTGLQAVAASPFKTAFVVDQKSGQVLYALSQNEELVKAARKKDPPPPPPPAPPTSWCCQVCRAQGGYACDPLADGSCICYGATRGGTGAELDNSLDTMAP